MTAQGLGTQAKSARKQLVSTSNMAHRKQSPRCNRETYCVPDITLDAEQYSDSWKGCRRSEQIPRFRRKMKGELCRGARERASKWGKIRAADKYHPGK